MGKNHKHKKALKSEKGKTKLKVKNDKTKFLPKGLNVTNTAFKIKPIILSEQLKTKINDKKFNIKELLSKLKHHNLSVKQESCDDLKQAFTHLPELGENLSEILIGIAPLLLERDKKIRRSGVDLFEKLFNKTPIANIEAFFGVLSSFLRCAMTNIDREVQEDSLLFLDVLLKFTPQFVANNCEKILPNLFALISKLRTDNKPGRTLSVNLGTKITNVKWRIQVLARLYTFLDAIITLQRCKSVKHTQLQPVLVASDGACVSFTHNPYKTVHNLNKTADVTEQSVITQHMPTLMSLLCEIWLEVLPHRDFKEIGTRNTALNAETASILSSILNIIYLLLQHRDEAVETAKNNQFLDLLSASEGGHFLKYVMSQFPFTQPQQKQTQSQRKQSNSCRILETNADPRCIQENLLICYVFCLLNPRFNNNTFKIKEANNLLSYITNDCLCQRKSINDANFHYLLLVLRTIFMQNSKQWALNVDMNEFLDAFVAFYEDNQFGNNATQEMLQLLCTISQTTHLKSPRYQRWLHDLSNVLCFKQVHETTLDLLLLISKQNHPLFEQGLADNYKRILDNYEKIHVIEAIKGNNALLPPKRKILYMFHYLKTQIDVDFNQLINNKLLLN